MTAPEPTAVERTIAGVDEAHQFGAWGEVRPGRYQRACTCGYLLDSRDGEHLQADMRHHRAQAVVAAIRDMPPEQMAELSPKPAEPPTVDGRTHRCPAPDYGGRHTAVGAGAVSSPYRCHGCGTWFTLDEVRDDM